MKSANKKMTVSFRISLRDMQKIISKSRIHFNGNQSEFLRAAISAYKKPPKPKK